MFFGARNFNAVDVSKTIAAPDDTGWSAYWSAGHEHSCPSSFQGFYGPQLQAFWRRQVEGLTPDDVVLDMGCGNGGLLRFLSGLFAAERRPQFHGVDLAELRPDWLAGPEGAGVTIHARTPMDRLPLPSASVSLAASLFGIEYANGDETWREVLRTLRPRARVALILHKRGSRVDRVAADDLAVGMAALAAGGIFDRARQMLPYLARAHGPGGAEALRHNASAEAARRAFNASTDGLVGLAELLRHGDYAHEILDALTRVLGETQAETVGAVDRQISAQRVGIERHLQRLAAMRASALDDAGIAAMHERLRAAGFTLAPPATLAEEGHEMGWLIEGSRSG